jgi:hypothetical protein
VVFRARAGWWTSRRLDIILPMQKFIEDFYQPTDCNDFSPAFGRALASAGTPALPVGFSLYFGNKTYNFTQTIHLNRAVSLIGSGAAGWYAGTIFLFPSGVPGLVCDFDPDGTRGTGAWSIVERIKFEGDGAGGPGGIAHGITLEARMSIRDCYITRFTGDGIHIEASTPASNANNWVISNVRIDGCAGDGLFITGTDANAGCATSLDSSENKGWGIRENSFLGNTYVACHCADNSAGAYTTRRYTGASDPNARSLFLNCYMEGGQISEVDDPSIVLGGSLNLTQNSTCVQLVSQFGAAYFDNGVRGGNRCNPLVQAAIGSDPGVALTLADGSPWPYRLHGPRDSDQWWQLKWAELDSAIPIRLSAELPGQTSGIPGGNLWMENGYYIGASDVRIRVFSGLTAPIAGTFQQGDRIMNVRPAVGDYAGWICTVAGSPGTWAPFGKIDPPA